MTYENLLITEDNGIFLLTINREKALNALNGQTMAELKHFFEQDAPKREGLTGVILTGAGDKAFVAGADIKEFLSLQGDQGRTMSKRGQDIFFSIERFNKPVIAAVNGYALGGGCELAMACHMRIATENARFGQPEINLGIIPGYGGTQRLIQYIGKSKAMELLLTGDMIKADEAWQRGLVNHVVPQGQEIEKAKEILTKVAGKAPIGVAKIIACVNRYFDTGDGFDFEVNEFGQTTTTEDFREGATAFIEKRPANFQGR
ncbi:MAG: enoyl-CoA hydratase-related protein [Bacteroidota bacterium]